MKKILFLFLSLSLASILVTIAAQNLPDNPPDENPGGSTGIGGDDIYNQQIWYNYHTQGG